jgi:Uma2 family endonuclease
MQITSFHAPPEISYLENGDRLTRQEFERRYQALPQIKKAELIEGVVYVPSPLRFEKHAKPHACIIGWLALYSAATPGVDLADNATVRLDWDNEPQPDALLRITTGGRSHINEDDYVEGAPELIAEIASSSASYDLHDKLTAYRRNGVQEYIVWQVYDRKLDWFSLQNGQYVNLVPDQEGVIQSQVFPGLNLPVEALLSGNLQQVLDEVQKGIQGEEHKAFVAKLAQT